MQLQIKAAPVNTRSNLDTGNPDTVNPDSSVPDPDRWSKRDEERREEEKIRITVNTANQEFRNMMRRTFMACGCRFKYLGIYGTLELRDRGSDMDETLGGRETWTTDMQAFKNVITSAGLGDIQTMGPLFTWNNMRGNDLIHRRLDRMLGNSRWFHAFYESFVHVKSKGLMDHTPLLLHVPIELEKIIKPFQLFYYMKELEGFQDVVRKGWSTVWYGEPMAILCQKMKEVKTGLRALNKAHGNLYNNVLDAREHLRAIQDSLNNNFLDPLLLKAELEASKRFEGALLEEEASLLQKSRVKWLNLGDGNKKFFFNQTKANWNKNKILAVENDQGNIVFGHKEVASIAVDFFANSLGCSPVATNINLDSLNCSSLTPTHALSLISEVTPTLVWDTLRKIKRNKAPRPDGFTMEFFIATWDIVGKDFCDAVIQFFNGGVMHPTINTTSLALIP
ncbi:hypothetical protein AgCh_032133 [Apium graveolens]